MTATPELIPFDENLLAHNEPCGAVSEWQRFNDILGIWATSFERDLEDELRYSPIRLDAVSD